MKPVHAKVFEDKNKPICTKSKANKLDPGQVMP